MSGRRQSLTLQNQRRSLIEEMGMSPRLRSRILLRRFDAGAKMRGCVPGPAGVIENPPRERDHVGVASSDDGLGLLEIDDQAGLLSGPGLDKPAALVLLSGHGQIPFDFRLPKLWRDRQSLAGALRLLP